MFEMDDRTVRAVLKRHWDASEANDFEVEHEIATRAMSPFGPKGDLPSIRIEAG